MLGLVPALPVLLLLVMAALRRNLKIESAVV
jgi:hypothetical protein